MLRRRTKLLGQETSGPSFSGGPDVATLVSQSVLLDSNQRIMGHTKSFSRFVTSAFGTVPGGPAADPRRPRPRHPTHAMLLLRRLTKLLGQETSGPSSAGGPTWHPSVDAKLRPIFACRLLPPTAATDCYHWLLPLAAATGCCHCLLPLAAATGCCH